MRFAASSALYFLLTISRNTRKAIAGFLVSTALADHIHANILALTKSHGLIQHLRADGVADKEDLRGYP